mmetsp:Transcript_20685/g.33528  ORF Transcript_20685/g.33528 Transcript_20685/m.33528 type:complete len:261 (+) Transcript_20685:237-1019(+)
MTAETSRAVPNGNGDGPELIRVVPRAVLSAEETVEEAVARRLAFFADQMVDEAAMLAASTFPISPEALIAKTKGILATNNAANDPSRLAADFHFVAPVVGPLPKEKFLEAFASFKLEDAFPDAKFNYHSFRVDPFEPNRVWYDSRFVGTHTGLLAGRIKATNILVKSPPQACSMLFNEAGECTQLTVGYVMDRQIGNTGGMGAVFGILYAIGAGAPFPEMQPYSKSLRYRFFTFLSETIAKLQKFFKRKQFPADPTPSAA